MPSPVKRMLPFASVWVEITKLKADPRKRYNAFRIDIYEGDQRHCILKAWKRPKNKKNEVDRVLG